MLRSPEPKTLFLKDYFVRKMHARKRILALLQGLYVLKQFSEKPDREQAEKKKLLEEFDFHIQYQRLIKLIERDACESGEHPYRMASGPPVPSYEEVISQIDLAALKEAALFCKPLLAIEPSDPGNSDSCWKVYVVDSMCKNDFQYSPDDGVDPVNCAMPEEGELEKHIRRIEMAESFINNLRNALYSLLYIF